MKQNIGNKNIPLKQKTQRLLKSQLDTPEVRMREWGDRFQGEKKLKNTTQKKKESDHTKKQLSEMEKYTTYI